MTLKQPAEGQPVDVTKYMAGGVFFSQDCPFADTTDWNMVECDIVVTVKMAHKPARFHKGDLQTMVMTVGRDSHWTGFENDEEE